jgi:hypothetical protein
MKKITIIFLTLIFASAMSCKKTETVNDNIDFETLNKTIVVQNNDSISGTCKDLIFEINSNNQIDFYSVLGINGNLIDCDGYNSILTNPDTEQVLPLDEGLIISEASNWTGIQDLSLDDFAGMGEKYIGYRSCFYPEGIDNFRYGWIKVNLSTNKDTLSIISRATNHTNHKSIKAGQVN